MKQKVGVITFHEANNYGAVLQAVALQKALYKIGAEPYIVNYRPSTQYGFKVPLSLHTIPYIPFLKEKEKSFNKFLKKNAKLTKKAKNLQELELIAKSFDVVITGSDQVFNPKWRNGDLAYLLNFAKPSQRFSYAASFGISEIPDDWASKIKPLLSEYNVISVREPSAKSIIENLGCKARVDCDPVLLLTKDEWLSLSKKPNLSNYLLLYTLESNDELVSFARKIAKERGLKIIQLTDSLRKHRGDITYLSYKGPEIFVGAFANASYIVTNSFHGLAFSSLLEKDFTAFLQNRNGAPNARLTDFVKKYSLEDCVYSQGGEVPHEHNFEVTRKLINDDRELSYSYISAFGNSSLAETKNKCAYCGACSSICPVNAITYRADSEGSKYPFVDKSKCIGCKQCEKVCPYASEPIKNSIQNSYGYASKILDERIASRSGGLFYSIAKGIINDGGIVYGAVIDDENHVKHIKGTTIEDIQKMQKSKYVQSDEFESALKDILNNLSDNKLVFVSGTPCFINAVRAITSLKNINTEKLYTMDIVCHGTPSPKIFRDYINKVESKNGRISSFQFRDKEKGWNTHVESFIAQDGSKHFSMEYSDIFYSHIFHRPSCYNCQFANITRPSDITGADFWGGQKIADFSDNKGASLVLINSNKGQELFDKYCLTNGIVHQIELKEFMQNHLKEPLACPPNRNKEWNIYYSKGFEQSSRNASKAGQKIRSKNKRKAFIVKVLRKLHIKK